MPEIESNIIPIDIEKEVRQSFLDYSMSVIVSRALPDVRDGLKPVHRRILYSLYEQGMTPDKPHRKSANIVGEVLGKYHPHGDSAVYDAMVRLAQEFSSRYTLVDGHGNFGSIDGDSAAAMRYTEVRMRHLAQEMLVDIDKDTVPFRPNYDDSREEPVVLPSRIPNLLINGSAGIAVGMATNIPPHNLGEVIDALILYLDDSIDNSSDNNSSDDSIVDSIENTNILSRLMKTIKGPDFPTGGIITGAKGIRDVYTTGRGSIKVRAKTTIEELKGGKNQIVVTEIPYMVNKARLVEKIADLVRERKVEGIADLRDESDRNGIRVVIELRKDVIPRIILNQLFKHTQLQDTFGVIMLALVDGVPRILNLVQMLEFFLEHRKEVVANRTTFELNVAKKRLHIVEGLRIALNHLDQIIALIRRAGDDKEAREGLMSEFMLSEEQATAILDMRMRRLTGLEREKLEDEFLDLLEKIHDLEDILERPERVVGIIKEELSETRAKFADPRRTSIQPAEDEDLEEEDLIQEESIVVTLTNRGYIKRQPLDTYHSQRRGGKGLIGTTTRAEDLASEIFVTSNLSTILFFTNKGKVFSLKAFKIPEASRQAKGTPAVNFLSLGLDEKVTTIIAVDDFTERRTLFMATRKGTVKKVNIGDFEHIRKSGIIAISLRDDDELVGVKKVDPGDQIIMLASNGYAIVFDEDQVRAMGRSAAGVRGITLTAKAVVVDVDKYKEGLELVIATQNGFGKRTPLEQFRQQNRGGKGLKAINLVKKNGPVMGAKVVIPGEEIMILSQNGIVIRLKTDDISRQNRYAQGVTLIRLDEGDQVASVARLKNEEDDQIVNPSLF
ncbi:MAG: DNA gyrase subunit A [Chitinophagales bacterium]